MSAWIVFVILAVPFLLLLALIASSDSFISIPAGRVGLLLIRGKATDEVLQPGRHWVPRLRQRMVVEYPSLEMSFRALHPDEMTVGAAPDLERTGPALRVTLGDRTRATIYYTIRFRLDLARLRPIHERFGPDGFWTAVRDTSAHALRVRLGDAGVSVDDVLAEALTGLEELVCDDVTAALGQVGFVVTMFNIGDVDLGRTGEVIQSTVRARLELEREEAESSVRVARARIDAELNPFLAGIADTAIRYREVDVLRDLVHSQTDRTVPLHTRAMIAVSNNDTPAEHTPRGEPAAAEPFEEP